MYNAVYNGIKNYFRFTANFGKMSSWVHYVLKSSCAKLLAAKYKLGSQRAVFMKFGKDLKGEGKKGFVNPEYRLNTNGFMINNKKIDIVQSLYTKSISAASLLDLSCSICDSDYRVEMHHVRHLKDLNPKISGIDRLMISRRRKQIPLCRECHLTYHRKTAITSKKEN